MVSLLTLFCINMVKAFLVVCCSAVRFEKAYCEYRLNRTQEALTTLRAGGDSIDNRCKELLAQVVNKIINIWHI